MRYILYLSLLTASGLLAGCAPHVSTRNVSSSKLLETFYRDGSTTMYFVVPTTFAAEGGRPYADIDFTYSHQKDTTLPVHGRFTFFTKGLQPRLESVRLLVPGGEIGEPFTLEKMSFENRNGWVSARYSFSMSYDVFKKFIESEAPKLVLTSAEKQWELDPPKRWKAYREELQNNFVYPIEN